MDDARNLPAADPPRHEPAVRYRVFFQTPDGIQGNCDVVRPGPLTEDDIEGLERDLLAAFGHRNVLVIGWQRLDDAGAPTLVGP